MKGFVTLAVGDEKYYRLAVNLLKSYKYHTASSYPFAIIADRKNKYTEMFDKVVILPNPQYSYMDKIEMLKNSPFDENIFIDADCLVYGNIEDFWQYMPNEGVSCFGKALSVTSKDGWFELSGAGKYRDKVEFIPQMHGGIIFFRNDRMSEKIYELAIEIAADYEQYTFKYFDKPADEPILALSMAVNDCKPIQFEDGKDMNMFLFYPVAKRVIENMTEGKLSYTVDGNKWINDVKLLHWQNKNTETPKYKIAVDSIENENGFHKIILKLKKPFYYIIYYFRKCFKRFVNGIQRRLH